MNTLKKWIRNVFGFSGKEINGFLILLPLMLILISSEPVYRMWITHRTDDFERDHRYLDSLAQLWKDTPSRDTTLVATSLFEFNPNKVSVTDMQRLGFSEGLSTRIANYRKKGGQFRIKPDLLKIYGIDSAFYRQLYSYILLPEIKERETGTQHEKSATQSQKNLLASFDLNLADTTTLKSVYGIGSKLASRIIRFREGLGGFIKREQVKEVYGLDTAVTQQLLKISFIAEDFTPRKINLNTASETEFSAHPYIKRAIAKAIVAYRFQHGNFAGVEELRKLTHLKAEDIDKIIPYLKIAD